MIIVNENAARTGPDEDPVGKRIRPESWPGPWDEVVGVAGDVRQNGLQAEPTMDVTCHTPEPVSYPGWPPREIRPGALTSPCEASPGRGQGSAHLQRSADGSNALGIDRPPPPLDVLLGLFAAVALRARRRSASTA